jgi:ribonuclease VapC
MNDAVLDSSVLLAILKGEPIREEAFSLLTRGVVSTVNLAELYSKLSPVEARQAPEFQSLLSTLRRVEIFTVDQAATAGKLRVGTSHAGLSLGDRACLALALELGAPVYTTDRNWLRVDVGCTVHCLR